MNASLLIPTKELQISHWFHEYSKNLLRFVKSRINNATEAEDIAQDVWYQLSLQNNINEIEQISSWLFNTAKNRVINFYKKKKNIPFSDFQALPEDGNEESTCEDIMFDKWATDKLPSDWLESGEFWLMLDNALMTLPTEQKEIFIAHELHDISFKEISKNTGIPINTLLARKRYAVLKLRDYFETNNL